MEINKAHYLGHRLLSGIKNDFYFEILPNFNQHFLPLNCDDATLGKILFMSHLTVKFATYITIAWYITFFIIKLLPPSPFSSLVFLICKKTRDNSVKFTTKK